jgi:hypothetical protein
MLRHPIQKLPLSSQKCIVYLPAASTDPTRQETGVMRRWFDTVKKLRSVEEMTPRSARFRRVDADIKIEPC